MAVFVAVVFYTLLQGIYSQFTVTIVSNPAGAPVSESTNTFDYPILSSVTLTCMVNPTPSSSVTYRWNTAGCYTNNQFTGSNPQCFPHGRTSQSVTDTNLNAEDAGTITCTVTISGSRYASGSLTLRISGIVITTNTLTLADTLTDYSYVTARSGNPNGIGLARCLTGLGPTSTSNGANGVLGGLYFNGSIIPNSDATAQCGSAVIHVRPEDTIAGVINFYQCQQFATAAEGVYTCTIMNSAMINQSVRFGIYLSGRTAPVIDTPSSSTVTVTIGSSLILLCTSRGSPPDTFTWRKDNGPVLQSTTTPLTYNDNSAVFLTDYSIASVTISDNGTYTCNVTNPIGSDSATFTVTVIVPAPVSDITVSNETVTSSAFTLTWMEVNLTTSDFSHYTIFYLPVSGPYGPIMTSNRRKRQSAQAGELSMDFTETTGTLTGLFGSVTYSIQVAVVGIFNGQEVIGDRSDAIEMTTLEGVPSPPRNLMHTETVVTGNMFNITLTWSRPDPPNGIITQYNVSYSVVDLQSEMVCNPVFQRAYISSSADLSHTWTNLIRGRYQFSVVAFTSQGPGEAVSFILSTLPVSDIEEKCEDDSYDNNGVIIALATLLVIAIIGLVISIVFNILLVVQHKKSRYDVDQKSNITYSGVKQSVSRDNTITDPIYVNAVKPSEAEYELIEIAHKPDHDVKMDTNPAYHATS